jgi:hypothetical protein
MLQLMLGFFANSIAVNAMTDRSTFDSHVYKSKTGNFGDAVYAEITQFDVNTDPTPRSIVMHPIYLADGKFKRGACWIDYCRSGEIVRRLRVYLTTVEHTVVMMREFFELDRLPPEDKPPPEDSVDKQGR